MGSDPYEEDNKGFYIIVERAIITDTNTNH
jgi:hypothetical protein